MENIRKYTDSDKEFVYQTKKEAYQKYFEKHFGSWNEEKQREYFNEYINKTFDNTFIIEDNKKSIGFYNEIDMEDGNCILGNICIIPDYQRRGIGTRVLKSIIASHQDNNIFIQYFKENPAGNLYKKLGFIPAGETEIYYQMVKLKEKKHIK